MGQVRCQLEILNAATLRSGLIHSAVAGDAVRERDWAHRVDAY